MFFKVVIILGQFVKEATSCNTWNASLEEVIGSLSLLLELCTEVDQIEVFFACNENIFLSLLKKEREMSIGSRRSCA